MLSNNDTVPPIVPMQAPGYVKPHCPPPIPVRGWEIAVLVVIIVVGLLVLGLSLFVIIDCYRDRKSQVREGGVGANGTDEAVMPSLASQDGPSPA
jgi:hypothetical protein